MKGLFSWRRRKGLGIFDGLVGKIIVLSLPDADGRRNRLPGHLAEFGITDFEVHDAFAPDHPQVRSLYDRGLVASFPALFSVRPGAMRLQKQCAYSRAGRKFRKLP
ncbi:hypothetical protein [Ruegeria meonggei]|uniref:hypothetical protein n=1 Tax=Ruegeria meonggei TaxID=1446476 RepID=UPI000A270BFE|nr:hypothetical protein [Ruegeria meonggei]